MDAKIYRGLCIFSRKTLENWKKNPWSGGGWGWPPTLDTTMISGHTNCSWYLNLAILKNASQISQNSNNFLTKYPLHFISQWGQSHHPFKSITFSKWEKKLFVYIFHWEHYFHPYFLQHKRICGKDFLNFFILKYQGMPIIRKNMSAWVFSAWEGIIINFITYFKVSSPTYTIFSRLPFSVVRNPQRKWKSKRRKVIWKHFSVASYLLLFFLSAFVWWAYVHTQSGAWDIQTICFFRKKKQKAFVSKFSMIVTVNGVG